MSEEENKEYEVEAIKSACVARKPGRGKRLVWKYLVKWKDFDDSDDDTWETVESFNGSEHLVEAFWERAKKSLKGRNIEDMSLFEPGEEFVPVGPPRKARTVTTEPDPSAVVESSIQNSPAPIAKRKQRLSTVGEASSVSAPPFSDSRPKRGKGNQSAVHSSQTPRRSLTAETSDKKSTEYEVEVITCARVARKPGRGERLGWKYLVKWKGYDSEENTWETVESFADSEHFVEAFWERAKKSLNGRDIEDMSLFRPGEEFFPIGPPRKTRAARKATAEPESSAVVENSVQISPMSTASRSTKLRHKSSVAEKASPVSAPLVPEERPRSKRVKGNQPAVHTSPTPSRSLDADTGDEEEYTVEAITRARVVVESDGEKIWQYRVKWKGWDSPEDDTWETVESFAGSEHFVEAFWGRVQRSLKGRNIENMDLFKAGEEFIPIGPTRKATEPESSLVESSARNLSMSTKRKRKSSVAEEALSVSTPVSEDRPSRSKRAKGNQSTPKQPTSTLRTSRNRHDSPEIIPPSEDDEEVMRPPPVTQSGSTSSLSSRRRRRRSPSEDFSEAPASSLVDALQRSYAMSTEEHVPAHRTRSANPRVKVTDGSTSMNGAISVKARLSGKAAEGSGPRPDSTRKKKSGPGRSSAGAVKNTSSLLTFEKGQLKSKKGRFAPVKPQEATQVDEFEDDVEMANPEPSSNFPAGPSSQEAVPTSEELLELAGLNKDNADELDDFDDNAEEAQEKSASLLQQSLHLAKEALFPASLSTASSSLTNAVSAAWKRSTIFGPLGLASESKPSAPSESTSSAPFLLNLDISVSVPVELADSSAGTNLDAAVASSSKGPPGKFYANESALRVLDTLRSSGSSARVIPSRDATDSHKSDFERFLQRLSEDELFIASAGSDVLVFCSSGSALISQRLNLPASLISHAGNVLVSWVSIDNFSAYANVIMDVDSLRW
ncbi:hypothetical protein VKT23_004273 [Stygiomarasmius scandens]|uniref:Chromo domain-containing protein n=1 Tax=Marasmiellus scandens TaxID=2682957 RepID=A0ABR1JU80_9AGAR